MNAKEEEEINKKKKETFVVEGRSRCSISIRRNGQPAKTKEVRKVRLVTLASSYSPIPLAHTSRHTKYLHDKKHGRRKKKKCAADFFSSSSSRRRGGGLPRVIQSLLLRLPETDIVTEVDMCRRYVPSKRGFVSYVNHPSCQSSQRFNFFSAKSTTKGKLTGGKKS